MQNKTQLIGLSNNELLVEILKTGEKKFHAKQLWKWIYILGAKSFDEMTNLSKELRQKLQENYTVLRPEIIKDLISKDGTRKWLLRFEDGNEVEMVYIPEEERGTLCISSQVGCAMGCKFCLTGTQKVIRNLTTSEIVMQFMIARDCLNEWEYLKEVSGTSRDKQKRWISSIVMMGMGEPFNNYDNVSKALKIIMDNEGIDFSKRKITISSCGIVPFIKKCAEDLGVNLAISLHAPTDEIRDKIMPINHRYKIDEIMKACYEYAKIIGFRKITFEYVMLKGINDSDEDARTLVSLIKRYRVPAKINLIPFNPWAGSEFECSDSKRIMAFTRIINDAGFAAPMRKSRGQDIMAACGQLKSESKRCGK